MAGTARPVSSSETGNVWMDGVLWTRKWSSGQEPTVISAYIAGQGGTEFVGPDDSVVQAGVPTGRELDAMTSAMTSFEQVCGLRFRTVASEADADLIWASVGNKDAGGDGILGWAWLPGTAYSTAYGDEQSMVSINHDAYFPAKGAEALVRGGFDYCTFIHELGHAMGLSHSHDDWDGTGYFPGAKSDTDIGEFGMNQGVFTMMGYNDGWQTAPEGLSPSDTWGYQATPMAIDIAALQKLYGANTTARQGGDTYTLPDADRIGTFYSCIWDTGGADLIVGAQDRANVIDLRAATLRAEPGGGGWVSHATGVHGGVTIAHGVVIENGRGGARDDMMTGNSAGNNLAGLGGNDRLLGRVGNDVLVGGRGDDFLYGGSGDDRLVGGKGADFMNGGEGRDVFVFGIAESPAGPGQDRIDGFERDRDVINLSGIDANGDGLGEGTFRLDTNDDFARAEIRQVASKTGLVLEMNVDGDAEADMSLLLLGVGGPLSVTDFVL
ncbi:M10 family metallopeptidase [Rubellimicrobium arenae]|uniref:M10 family metallopeptidase n=1 Tax=Rubellimicrobium arenae TaxID=2817372 RepID=UPI001B30C4A2|nr:M10 family metallopeptidase [Rubellimicrobium arenae]